MRPRSIDRGKASRHNLLHDKQFQQHFRAPVETVNFFIQFAGSVSKIKRQKNANYQTNRFLRAPHGFFTASNLSQ
jgi:hypothetical protein